MTQVGEAVAGANVKVVAAVRITIAAVEENPNAEAVVQAFFFGGAWLTAGYKSGEGWRGVRRSMLHTISLNRSKSESFSLE